MKKILVYGRTLPEKATGMSGTFELHQANALKKYGHQVAYGFVDNRSIKSHRKVGSINKIIDGVETFGTYMPIGGIPKIIFDRFKAFFFFRLWNKIISHFGHPDVVHVHFPLVTLNEQIIDFLANQQVKLVTTEHWTKVLNKELSDREVKILCKLSKYSDCTIAVSEELKNAMEETLRENGQDAQICVVPNMINDKFQYTPRKSDNNFSFAVIGRLSPEKRLDAIIHAFSSVHDQYEQARLYIIGEGSDYKRLSTLVSDLSLDNNVIFTGYLTHDELMKYFENIDVTVNSAVGETFGVPAVESWYLGRPTILPNHHPMAINVNSNNGIVYENSTDKQVLVENIITAMFKSVNRKFNNEQISGTAKDVYSEYSVCKRLSEIYDKH